MSRNVDLFAMGQVGWGHTRTVAGWEGKREEETVGAAAAAATSFY